MGDVFQDLAVTAAIIYRLVHHSRAVLITGNSYSMKDYKQEREQRSKKKIPEDPLWLTGKTVDRKMGVIAYNYGKEAV